MVKTLNLPSLILLCAALASSATAADPVVRNCLVRFVDDVEVPAREAGILRSIDIKEGSEVTEKQKLAGLDDTRAQLQLDLAQYDYAAAHAQAKSDVDVRYYTAAAKVELAEHQEAVDANEQSPGAVAAAEVRRRDLEYDRAVLQIEQAEMQQKIAHFTAGSKKAERDAAQDSVNRRKILAPIAGMVIAINRDVGEWVQPGDPVMRVVRLDKLKVEGFLNVRDFDPSHVDGRQVTVAVHLAGGPQEFNGKIVFVNPLVRAGGDYLVKAEVTNLRAKDATGQRTGSWLLRAGLNATMTIHTGG